MARALELAQQAADLGEVPVGAVLVCAGEVIAEAYNQPITACDATAHAEIMALRQGGAASGNYRLPGATLYVTIEPCTMCVGALIHARVARVVFGASEPKAGALVSQMQLLDLQHWNHHLEYTGGVLAESATALMQAFFKSRRTRLKQLKQLARQQAE